LNNIDQSQNFNRTDQGKKVILLDRSRTERAFDDYESLWDIEIQKIEDRLTNHIESLESYRDELESWKKPILSIAIMGYTGSGKTSMLHTLVERVNQGNLNGNKLNSQVFTLPVIKPNLVAEGDHFLYAFLAEALRADRSFHKKKEDLERDNPFISPVQHQFQEVSEYLQVLNQTGRKYEGDSLGISLERLERHESGLMLIDKMNVFIDELANSLGQYFKHSVILLPVDDADISQEVLISALDTCWRFIKHPRLIPIFTFTGRLSEELLRVYYDEKINRSSSLEKLTEASTSMLVTENMAIQYLGKLFPVRNRIRMGPASARVQAATYKPLNSEGKGLKVSKLLETASRLLYGKSPLYVGNIIRPPFRMVTLRRQIQIIDAVQGAGIEQFMVPVQPEHLKPWVEVFDLASWSLINAHRDVLKEIHLNLDDLYGWTPFGLRQVILDCILMQDSNNMNKLHKHWRYRTNDRRSQIISLLAVNVFRPRMEEEPTGDDSPKIIDEWWDNRKNKNKILKKEVYDSFSVSSGVLWFLNLSISFYLPQIFFNRRLNELRSKELVTDRVTGVGWGLISASLHAVQEALKRKKAFSTGILFLDPGEFDNSLKGSGTNKNKRFFTHIWCLYGFHDEWPWAAVSLWRGLGLMGKIIEVFANHPKRIDEEGNYCFDVQGFSRKTLISKFAGVIQRHVELARVVSNLPKGKKVESEYGNLETENWGFKDITGTSKGSGEVMVGKIPGLAEAMCCWLEKNSSIELSLNGKEGKIKKENRINPMEKNEDWETCFIRRIHGDNLMSVFWQKLENAYFKKKLEDWTMGSILYYWKKLLSRYWDGCEQIKDFIASCPIWPDYNSHDLYAQKPSRFSWGTTLSILSLDRYEEKIPEFDANMMKMEKELSEKKEKFNESKGEKENDKIEKEIKALEVEIEREKLKKEKLKEALDKKKKIEEKNEDHRDKSLKEHNIYNAIVEEEYNQRISVKRANVENYLLFHDDEKSVKKKEDERNGDK